MNPTRCILHSWRPELPHYGNLMPSTMGLPKYPFGVRERQALRARRRPMSRMVARTTYVGPASTAKYRQRADLALPGSVIERLRAWSAEKSQAPANQAPASVLP